MENASKALFIAGGVLLGILFATFVVYVATQMRETFGKYKEDLNRETIVEFNQQYQKYSQKKLTYQDIASLINQAKNDNKKQEFPTTIKICMDSINGEDLVNKYTVEQWLSGNINSTQIYICEEVHINETTTLVDYIVIKKE